MRGKATASFSFRSMAAAMDGPRSAYFGLGGRPRNPKSYYNKLDAANLTFDVSNNQILCSITAEGLPEHACVLKGLSRGGPDRKFVGAYVTKHVIGGGPWPFAIELGGKKPRVLHELGGIGVKLLGGLFPVFAYKAGPVRVRQLAFAPLDVARPEHSPRAFILAFEIRNLTARTVRGALVAPESSGQPRWAIAPLDGPGRRAGSRRAFSLAGGRRRVFSYVIGLGRNARELSRAISAVRRSRPLRWLNDAWRYHAGRMGELSIPPEPFYAESFHRMAELCRQSVVRLGDGRFGGGFWGSRFTGAEAWETPFIWLKDAFHAMLPMGMLHPRLCADAALWFLEWAVPSAAFGPGAGRFDNPGRVTHSLVNALAAFQLAGEYYRSTGDGKFFRRHPELLAGARRIFREVLESRRGQVFLFPSLYISDGPARGDYHTGSNVVFWDALCKMARLAREVYNEPARADEWAAAAAKLREAILTNCAGGGAPGRRFFEGANADGTKVPGHDGEETDTTLMPFYGFCEQDDEALINHANVAFTSENFLYWPEMDGVWWTDDQRFGATFPAWMTHLAGSADEAQLAAHLERIRRLTDLDGSIWWWPYRAGATDLSAPTREPSGMKSAWAAGVYLCLFVNNILGLRADRPGRTVAFRPFCPWPAFTWKGCRLGESCFDVTYRRTSSQVSGAITNRNAEPCDGLIELTLPAGASAASLPAGARRGNRYGRESVAYSAKIAPGRTLRISAQFR
jgi:hypothetical protein